MLSLTFHENKLDHQAAQTALAAGTVVSVIVGDSLVPYETYALATLIEDIQKTEAEILVPLPV